MGLNHPDSLEDWRRWARPSALRRAVVAVRGRGRLVDPALRLLLYGTAPTVLAALDSATLSGIAAGLRPVALGPRANVAVLCPPHLVPAVQAMLGDPVEDRSITFADELSVLDGTVRAVLSLGHFLRAGELAQDWAAARGVEYIVVQHGLLTPFTPPLPDEVTLYAFSHEDGAFWTGGRPGRTVRMVGSQILWEASDPQSPAAQPGPTVFLGQLHGRELGRWSATQQTLAFLRAEPHVLYRPHPSERDMLSRATHHSCNAAAPASRPADALCLRWEPTSSHCSRRVSSKRQPRDAVAGCTTPPLPPGSASSGSATAWRRGC